MNLQYGFGRTAGTARTGVTAPFGRRWLHAIGLPFLTGMAMLVGGCTQSPVIGLHDTPPAPVADGVSAGDRPAGPAAIDTDGNGPADEPSSPVATPSPAQPAIAVGPDAREVQYASLVNDQNALASRNLGYFIDVHEARLRQALTNTPARMERAELWLRLTVPGSLSFAPDSAEILESARPVLIAIATVLAEFDKTLVSVHGHTDRSGNSDYNRLLSRRRAVAVARFLISHGVSQMRLVGIGHGEDMPAVDGDSDAVRAANRRIEILIEPVVTGDKVAGILE